jgi:hypothetical protein
MANLGGLVCWVWALANLEQTQSEPHAWKNDLANRGLHG